MNKQANTKNGKVDFDEILLRPKTLPVEWEGLTINIKYNRAAISHRMIREMGVDETDPEKDLGVEHLLSWLMGWDIVRQGEPVPINKDTLDAFPESLLGALVRSIHEDLYPNRETATA